MSVAYRKYSNKRVNSARQRIPFLLSFEEYCQLLEEAGITVEQVGIKGYHLSRKQDKGAYCIGNCRFVPYLDNLREKVPTQKSREASATNIKKCTKEQRHIWSSKGGKIAGKISGGRNKLKQEEVVLRLERIEGIDLTKFGWVQKVANTLGITHTHARRFVSKYYEGKVYNRKSR